jgi:Zn finger protein HypA/HybF involved in hydrogenase expression
MIDEEFKCENCGEYIKPLGYTARDHCPHCLYSKHVDNNPGDRECNCHGLLKPIAIENFKDSYKIVYRCEKCKSIKKNIVANDDNMDLIIDIMSNPINIE